MPSSAPVYAHLFKKLFTTASFPPNFSVIGVSAFGIFVLKFNFVSKNCERLVLRA